MNWLHYLVEANIYLGVFYLCYCLFLNNETHYLLGRAYLLFSCVVSFILPVTQLSILKPVEELTLEPIAYTQPANNFGPVPEITIVEPVKHVTMDDVLFYAYIAGAVATLVVLFYRLYRLSLLTRKSKALYGNKYKLIQLNGDNTAFSFFNYLFIGTEVPQAETIIAHELVHIRQKHSADIIFVELLKVVSWFNPFIYLLQRSLRTVHEYIADEQTAAQERDALTYSSFLLNSAYGIQGSPIAHSFFNYNLLKKRIIMLNQKRSGRLARLKYLAAAPLCMGMLCASTLVFSKNYAFIDLAPKAKPAQAEISIDEPITKTIKYFKIIDKVKDITAYSDNLSLTDKGIKRKFFAKSTSPEDIAYIQKTIKLTVEVIDVDSHTRMPVAVPEVTKADTNKRKLFPPPPPYSLRTPYEAVSAYLHKTIKFPAEALKAKENGAVVLSFKLDAAGRINDIKVLQSKGAGYEAAALKALEGYPYPIKEEAGEKILEMNFWLPNNQATYLASNKTRMIPGFVGNIIFHNEAALGNIPNLPPPPPPGRPKKVGALKGLKLDAPIVVTDVRSKAAPEIETEPVPAVKAAPKVLIDVKPPVKAMPEITIDPVPAKPAKRLKNLKIKSVKAPVVKTDLSNVDIVIDSPVVVTDVKLDLKEVNPVKPVIKLKLSKVKPDVNLKLTPVVIDNVKPIVFR